MDAGGARGRAARGLPERVASAAGAARSVAAAVLRRPAVSDHDAARCGSCAVGPVLAAASLPSRAALDEGLAGAAVI